ncbi:MAG TPA: hypothetical protein VGD76_01965 [Ramlibacter sp.]
MKRFTSSLKRAATLPLALAATLLLASCGGGDPFAGLWTGSLEGNRQARTIMLGDGSYYMLYTRAGTSLTGGFIRGQGDFHGARITSTDARDYNWEGRRTRPATLEAKLSPRQSVSGTVGGTVPFELSYQKEFDYDAQLALLAGAFKGQVAFVGGYRNATFTVSPTGALSTDIDGCLITGTVSPRADGNAYDLTITFGGGVCVFPHVSFTGVALFGGEDKRLDAAVVNPAFLGGQGIAFTGFR